MRRDYLAYSAILPHRSFEFAMTKHSSKLSRPSDPYREKTRLQADSEPEYKKKFVL